MDPCTIWLTRTSSQMDHGCFGSRYGHIVPWYFAHSFYCLNYSDMIVISLAWSPINHIIECLDINNYGQQGWPRQSSPHNPLPMNSARHGSPPIALRLTIAIQRNVIIVHVHSTSLIIFSATASESRTLVKLSFLSSPFNVFVLTSKSQVVESSAKPLDRAMLSHRLGTRW